MSKMDNLRAMREARYEQAMKRAGSTPARTRPRPPVAPADAAKPTRATKPKAQQQATPTTDAAEELCGHRNMGGKSCTREKGHAAKSHRYS